MSRKYIPTKRPAEGEKATVVLLVPHPGVSSARVPTEEILTKVFSAYRGGRRDSKSKTTALEVTAFWQRGETRAVVEIKMKERAATGGP